MSKRWRTICFSVLALGLGIRLLLLVWAGNSIEPPFGGGSDTLAYQTLATNLLNHRGMSYAGQPTALRPPLYPLFLTLVRWMTGDRYRLIVRLIQFLVAIFLAYLCAMTTRRLGGSTLAAFTAALAAPTLVFLSAEILTEPFAALLVALFFCTLIAEITPVANGAVIGLGMLQRFNFGALAIVYAAHQLIGNKRLGAKRVGLAAVTAVLIVSPWVIRNWVVFNGQLVYSTQSGITLLQGITTPDGRTQPGDTDKLKQLCGYVLQDIETNSAHRLNFAAEPELNRQAERAAIVAAAHVNLLRLTLQKLGFFWLSFDQLFNAQSLSRLQRIARGGAILVYWGFLVLAVNGWHKLRIWRPRVAALFVLYAVVVTVLHLPFVMNTRIRAPLIEPALAILIGCAWIPVGLTNPVENVEHSFR